MKGRRLQETTPLNYWQNHDFKEHADERANGRPRASFERIRAAHLAPRHGCFWTLPMQDGACPLFWGPLPPQAAWGFEAVRLEGEKACNPAFFMVQYKKTLLSRRRRGPGPGGTRAAVRALSAHRFCSAGLARIQKFGQCLLFWLRCGIFLLRNIFMRSHVMLCNAAQNFLKAGNRPWIRRFMPFALPRPMRGLWALSGLTALEWAGIGWKTKPVHESRPQAPLLLVGASMAWAAFLNTSTHFLLFSISLV
jgi:hypothetical protein